MVISQQLVQEIQGLRTDKVLVFTVDKAFPSLTGMSAEPKGRMRNGPRGREAQHFSPTFSLVASIPANHRGQNSRANCRDWKWQCCRKGKSGSRQSYETDIIQVKEGWAGWPPPNRHPYSWHLYCSAPKSLCNKKAYLFPLSGE